MFDFCRDFEKICEILPTRKPGKGQNRSKNGVSGGSKTRKMHFYFIDIQQDNKKMQEK